MEQRLREAVPLFHKYPSPISVATRMAQFALESMAGTSPLFKRSFNGFGIKASAPWTGERVSHNSMEVGGARDSDFRKYASLEESIKDHASFFESTDYRKNVAYAKAIEATTYVGEAGALTGVYAGDPEYGRKLIEIVERYNLTQYDIKQGGTQKMAYIGIDIGHGSNTWSSGGGKGVVVSGITYQEHNFNSIVAKKLKTLLEQSGHKVTFGVQQPNSPDTSLASRTSRFNAEKVDILISVHANWVGNFGNSTNGIAAFYDGYISGSWRLNQSLKLAKTIMARYKAQGQSIYTGGMGDGQGAIPSYSGSWTDFHMNRVSTMPSVLMELGFMSGNKDFDKIFGSQQAKYTDQMAQGMLEGINAYFGVESKPVDVNNPQGMSTTPMKPYMVPSQSFAALKKGEKVTLAVNFQWADLAKQELLRSFKYDEYVGTTDEIVEVKDVSNLANRNHSNRAYLLKGYNSWILEEYLIESKRDWKDGIVDVPDKDLPDAVEDDEYDVYEFEKGFVKIRKTS